MVQLPHNFYLTWRARRTSAFAEKPDQAPPEMLLQQVWLHQRLVQDRLLTSDGRRVKVLHPGFWNREAGPDFQEALVQIGEDAPMSGDVEIDIVPAGWTHHAHATNPSYRNVVLHVTWEPTTSPRHGLPSLSLKHALDSTVPELNFWLGIEPKPLPGGMAGKCAAPLRNLSSSALKGILRQAGEARLRCKAEQFQARARQAGWEGALWEGLFAALGYKRNTWPMRRLAELLPSLTTDLSPRNDSLPHLQARLLGVAGLIPAEIRLAPGTEQYLRNVWNFWWRDAEAFRDRTLPATAWKLGGIRPANHPQRRLAVGAHWALRRDFIPDLERWLTRSIESPDLLPSLEEILQVRQDPFWSHRWTLRSQPFREPQALLGEDRITDLATNVIIPWLYVRALAGRNEQLARAAESRYFLWPAGEDNAVLKRARARLLGGIPARFLKSAGEQQALLQIVKDFCDHSNSACHHCAFPELVSDVAMTTSGE